MSKCIIEPCKTGTSSELQSLEARWHLCRKHLNMLLRNPSKYPSAFHEGLMAEVTFITVEKTHDGYHCDDGQKVEKEHTPKYSTSRFPLFKLFTNADYSHTDRNQLVESSKWALYGNTQKPYKYACCYHETYVYSIKVVPKTTSHDYDLS